MDRYLETPLTKDKLSSLHAGDMIYLTGTIYTARDAAHKRMDDALNRGEALPFDIKDQTIYYMGPSPASGGRPIGAAGPTTAGRMDKYTPRLLERGCSKKQCSLLRSHWRRGSTSFQINQRCGSNCI